MTPVAEVIESVLSTERQSGFESSSEGQIYVTLSQLEDLISPLLNEISDLKTAVAQLKAVVAYRDEKIAALESTQETQADNQLIQLRLISQLREATKKNPQPLQKDRGEILRALLAANGGKMLAKDARQKMHLSKSRFSELLKVCDFIETKPLHSDKRKEIIILKSELVPRN